MRHTENSRFLMKPVPFVLVPLCTAALALFGASHRHDVFSSAHGTLVSSGQWGEVESTAAGLLKRRYMQRLSADGTMPQDGMAKALAQRERLIQAQGGTIASPTWTYRGPDNVGGRIRPLVVHPTNANTIWVGSVGGGIWKTTNAGTSWTKANDFLPSLCIGSMVIDKTNPNVLYAGTGESYFDTEFGENNKSAIMGAGIYKTTDGGATWATLEATKNADFNCVSRLSMSPTDPQTLLASTNTGIFRTSDGGTTWTKVYNGKVYDVDFHPTDGNRVVAGLPAVPGVVTSSDGGATWTPSTGITTNVRCETIWSRAVTGNVYAAVCNGGLIRVWKSTNFGQTWTLRTTGSAPSNYDAYNCAVWVDPTNDNNVIVGGVYLFRSTNGGTSFTQTFNNVHPDIHGIVESSAFNGTSNRTVFFATDGGVARATDYQGNSSTHLNSGLGITQFYGGAINDTSGRIVAGAQDNYTQVYTGTLNWTGVIGGDGVYCASDPQFPSVFYAGYYYMNMFRDDGSLGFATGVTGGISDRGSEVSCNFVPYVMLDPNQSNTMLACARRLWRSTAIRTSNNPPWTIIKPQINQDPPHDVPRSENLGTDHFAPESPLNLSFCAVAKSNSNVIWAAHNNGQIFKSTDGLATSPSWTRVDLNGPLPARWPSCIVIDNANADHVYLTYLGFESDNVWETTDGGATFHQVTGVGLRQLPAAPVSSIALDPVRPGHLIVGTDIGIFTSWDNGATWSAETQGPGTVPIDFMQWRNNSQLMVYTYGRGAWQGDVNPVDLVVTPSSFNTFRGILDSGGLADVQTSDDSRLVVRNGLVINQTEAPVTVDFTATSPNSVASSLTVTTELSVTTGGLVQKIQAFDFDASAWVELDSRAATLADQVATVAVNSNVSRFIEPGTKAIKLRVRIQPGGPVGASSWSGRFDLVRWSVSQ